MNEQDPQQNSRRSKTGECARELRSRTLSLKDRSYNHYHENSRFTGRTNVRSCPRCQGFMVSSHFMDSFDLSRLWVAGWRCINCGVVVDSVIVKNWKYRHPKKRSSRRPRLPK